MTVCRTCGHSNQGDVLCEICRRPLLPEAATPGNGAQSTPQMPHAGSRVSLTGEAYDGMHGPAGQSLATQQMAPQPSARVSLTGEVYDGASPANGAQPTLAMAPQPQTVRRVALTGEVMETTQAIPAHQLPGAAPGMQAAYGAGPHAPAYAGTPGGGAPMLPAAAYSAAAFAEQAAADGPSLSERWEKALAIALPIVAVSMLVVHFAPMAMFVVVFADLFVVPIILGATGAIPRYEDAILDCSIMLVVSILLGPLIALGAYLLTAMVKQECNPAILALLGLNILLKGLFGIAFAPAIDTVALAAMWGFLNMLGFFGICLSFLGWLLSSFFRPIGE